MFALQATTALRKEALALTSAKPSIISSAVKALSSHEPQASRIASAAVLNAEHASKAHEVAMAHFMKASGGASCSSVEVVKPVSNPKLDYFLESGKRLLALKQNLDHMATHKLNLVKKDHEGNTLIEFKGVHFTHSGVKTDVTCVTHYFSPIKQSIAYYDLAKGASLDPSIKAYLADPKSSFDAAKFSDLCLGVQTSMKSDSDEAKVLKFVIYLARNLSDKLDALKPSTVIDAKYFNLDRKGQELLAEFTEISRRY